MQSILNFCSARGLSLSILFWQSVMLWDWRWSLCDIACFAVPVCRLDVRTAVIFADDAGSIPDMDATYDADTEGCHGKFVTGSEAGMKLHEIASLKLHEVNNIRTGFGTFLLASSDYFKHRYQHFPAFSTLSSSFLVRKKSSWPAKVTSRSQPSFWDTEALSLPCVLMAFSNYKGTLRCQCSRWREESVMLGCINHTDVYICMHMIW